MQLCMHAVCITICSHVVVRWCGYVPKPYLLQGILRMVGNSLVPRPEKEEEKGPDFSRSRMCLIISNLTTC